MEIKNYTIPASTGIAGLSFILYYWSRQDLSLMQYRMIGLSRSGDAENAIFFRLKD